MSVIDAEIIEIPELPLPAASPDSPIVAPIVATLRAAQARIADPVRWTQRAIARTIYGLCLCSVEDPNAVRWCALGSLQREAHTQALCRQAIGYLDLAASELLPEDPDVQGHGALMVYLNDHCGHERVMRMFERAIELASA